MSGRAGGAGYARTWALLRLLVAALALVATAEQVRLALEVAAAAQVDPVITVVRLFTFFTVLSNGALTVVFTVAGFRALRRRELREPPWLAVLLASMSTCMIVTGLVYNAVLRSADSTDILGGWSNGIHHVVAPLFVLADVFWAPRRRALPWRAILWGLAFPIGWLVLTLAAGPYRIDTATGRAPWYPYPFLDPATAGGYVGVAIWVAAIAGLIAVTMAGVVAVGRLRDRVPVSSRSARSASSP